MTLFTKKRIIAGPVCRISNKVDESKKFWFGIVIFSALSIVAMLAFVAYSNYIINNDNFSFVTDKKSAETLKIDEMSLKQISEILKNKDLNYKNLTK